MLYKTHRHYLLMLLKVNKIGKISNFVVHALASFDFYNHKMHFTILHYFILQYQIYRCEFMGTLH